MKVIVVKRMAKTIVVIQNHDLQMLIVEMEIERKKIDVNEIIDHEVLIVDNVTDDHHHLIVDNVTDVYHHLIVVSRNLPNVNQTSILLFLFGVSLFIFVLYCVCVYFTREKLEKEK